MSKGTFPFYVSCDLETTGLDPDCCQTLEFGIILDNFVKPLDKCPTFRRVIRWSHIVGEPFALAMNADLIKLISQQNQLHEKLEKGKELTDEENARLDPEVTTIAELIADFHKFLRDHSWDGEEKLSFAGKNFSGFDAKFLSRLAYERTGYMGGGIFDDSVIESRRELESRFLEPSESPIEPFDKMFVARHRVIDVATHFWVPRVDGMELPNLSTCLKRAGLPSDVAHTAVDDARKVCLLVRHVTAESERLYGATA